MNDEEKRRLGTVVRYKALQYMVQPFGWGLMLFSLGVFKALGWLTAFPTKVYRMVLGIRQAEPQGILLGALDLAGWLLVYVVFPWLLCFMAFLALFICRREKQEIVFSLEEWKRICMDLRVQMKNTFLWGIFLYGITVLFPWIHQWLRQKEYFFLVYAVALCFFLLGVWGVQRLWTSCLKIFYSVFYQISERKEMSFENRQGYFWGCVLSGVIFGADFTAIFVFPYMLLLLAAYFDEIS